MKIYFIRHCKTNNNLKNRWQGRSDVLPSKKGLKELEKLSQAIYFVPNIIFTSPLKRATITVDSIKKEKSKIIVTKKILERDFGKLEGLEVNEKDKELLANFSLNTNLNMGVEKIQDMYFSRIKPFLLNLKRKYEKKDLNIVIVAHSWVGRLLAYFASNEKQPSLIKIAPKHAIIYEYNI